jgi:hypothetical protein
MNKIHIKISTLLAFSLFGIISCVEQKQNKGLIEPAATAVKLDFTTSKTVIILPAMLNGVAKNFLFDTGADLTLLNREKITGRISKVTGSGGKKVSLGSEIIGSFKIADTNFKNTCAYNDKMTYFDNLLPDFGGVIGQPIISKANWLIDYPKSKMIISDKTIETLGFETFKMKNVRAPEIDIQLEGETITTQIDLGSSTALAIPASSNLAAKLLAKYTFKENTREVYRAGGSEVITEKVAIIPLIKFGSSEAVNIETKIYNTKNIRIGNDFFKDFTVYIDNTNGAYKVKKTK